MRLLLATANEIYMEPPEAMDLLGHDIAPDDALQLN
ncbi:unnamed protein product, partial [Tilletia controversa]